MVRFMTGDQFVEILLQCEASKLASGGLLPIGDRSSIIPSQRETNLGFIMLYFFMTFLKSELLKWKFYWLFCKEVDIKVLDAMIKMLSVHLPMKLQPNCLKRISSITCSLVWWTQHNKNKVQACIAMVSDFIYQIKMNVNGSEKKHNIKTFH